MRDDRRMHADARSRALRSRIAWRALWLGACLVVATGMLGAHRALAEPVSLDSLKHALELGHYAEAERAGQERLGAEEKAHGPESAEVGQTLDGLAFAKLSLGRAAEARALAERAVLIKEKRFGSAHPELARSLNALARALWDLDELDSARVVQERAVGIDEKALGPDDLEFARMLYSLGSILGDAGDYAGAIPRYQRVLAIRERQLGPDHLLVAQTLNGLGIDLKRMGDYVAAKPAYERALAIREKQLPPDHPDVAWSLNNYANLLYEFGEYEEARKLHARALAIREKTLGPDHPDVAFSLHNLGNMLEILGDPRGALPLEERALAIREKVYGPNHERVASTLASLALVVADLGQYARAESLYRRSLAVREQSLGPEHPDVARTLTRLAALREWLGDDEGARSCCARALAIREKAYSPHHPETAQVRGQLAISLARLGRWNEAFSEALRTENDARYHFRLTAQVLDEREALMYAGSRPGALDLAIELASQAPHGPTGADSLAWDALVRSRALVLDEMAQRNRTLVESGDSTLSRLAAEVARARADLACLVVRGPDGVAYATRLAEAQRHEDEAEAALATRSARFRLSHAADDIGLAQALAALPPRSALVSFRRAQRLDQPGPDSTARPSDYFAFVARAGFDRVTLIRLGRADSLETLVSSWLEEAAFQPTVASRARREAACRAAGLALRARIWDPLEPALAGAERVLLVPDAALNLVNFAALPAEGGYLVEHGPEIHILSCERDLVAFARSAPTGLGLLAFGEPAFDHGTVAAPAARRSATRFRGAGAPADSGTARRGARGDCADFDSLRFAPLPSTLAELGQIAALWKSAAGTAAPRESLVERIGDGATEEAFKKLAPSRRVLHLATHGFFLSPECADPRRKSRTRAISDERTTLARENPLVRSGLALAGANRRGATGVAADDGLLTAQEIASLDLSGVEWAVLSACGTGRGEIQAGEGVLGLRRAFQVAGASTVIMSLWSVADAPTRRWMRALYEARLRRRLDSAEAVRAADLEVLRERRRLGRSTHPFYWAAFVAAGDWR